MTRSASGAAASVGKSAPLTGSTVRTSIPSARPTRAWNVPIRPAPTTSARIPAMLRASVGRQHPAHQLVGAVLGERLVEVPALRRLDAGRAAVLARALPDEPVRVGDELLEV